MNGGVGLTGQSPCAAWMSVWHRPAVSTLTSTSPGPGTGLGTCSTLSGLVKSWTTAAFMGLSKVVVLLAVRWCRAARGPVDGARPTDPGQDWFELEECRTSRNVGPR